MSEFVLETCEAADQNPALIDIPSVPSNEEVASMLGNVRLLENLHKIRNASTENKIAALSDFDGAYAPNNTGCRMVQEAVRKGRIALSYRNVNDRYFARSLLQQATMLNDRVSGPLPSSPMRQDRKVEGMMLAGVSGNGRSTLMGKAAGIIGTEPKPLKGTVAVPVGLNQVPALYIRWPSCGTPEQFHYEMRILADAALGTQLWKDAIRKNFKKNLLPSSTKSIALLLSPALLFVDGVNSCNVSDESDALFAYLAEFMDYTGIPVVLSCTSPIAARLAEMGEIGVRLGVQRAVRFDNMPYGPDWVELVRFFWGHDLRKIHQEMPTNLPLRIHGKTNGNISFLRAVMERLLVELIFVEDEQRRLSARETLVLAETVASEVMMPFRPLMRLLDRDPKSVLIANKDRQVWGDYLPRGTFDLLPSEDEPNRLSYSR